MMRNTLMDPAFARESSTTRARIQQVHDFLDTSSAWVDEMQRLDPATLMKIMKLGSKIQRLLGGSAADVSGAPTLPKT